MIELPEALNVAKQLQNTIAGKTVSRVLPPTKAHKFCWYSGEPTEYDEKIKGHGVRSAEGFGIFVELTFDNGQRLCINDGVNVRFVQVSDANATKNYQLKVEFTDGTALLFTVAMYGGIIMHDGSYDNEYYRKSRNAFSPFSPGFESYFRKLAVESKPTLSVKAFLATEQRFPGIGNGVLQDILFAAQIHPKRKIGKLTDQETENLLSAVVTVLGEMTDLGGRDTEKDLFGDICGYKTKMSRNTLAAGCSVCGGEIKKEAYLGGSVYYCTTCQPMAD